MEWYYIVLIAVVAFVILDFLASLYLCNVLINPMKRTLDELLLFETTDSCKFTMQQYKEEFNFEEEFIKSEFGYNLKLSYLKPMKEVNFKDGKKRVAIMVHGWTSNRYSMFAYGRIYSLLGFHVFLYDHRNHFESDSALTSMGYYESMDLETILKHVKNKMGDNIVIGTHGESMGSATVMMHAGKYQNVDFVCEDCGFTDLNSLLLFQAACVKFIPPFPTIPFANIIFKKKLGISFKDVRPIDWVKKCDDIPMYFVHGKSDRFVPFSMVKKLYDAKKGFKMIDTYKKAKHARSISIHKEEYYINLENFLRKANIID